MSNEKPRRLVLLRHAKTEWDDEDDQDRSLADRGRADAPLAGRWLAGTGVTPDLALCSTAARCRETWELVAAELPDRPRTVHDERLYEAASPDELIPVLNGISDEVGDAVLIGHNPGVRALADALAGDADGELLPRMNRSGFPTCGIAVLTFSGPWRTVEPAIGRLTAFWTPRG
jgi:phosphohistidine phosphatase